MGVMAIILPPLVENPLSVETMEQAMIIAAKAAQAGDMILLSPPACASFDQFPNFMARGDAFVALATELQNTVSGAN